MGNILVISAHPDDEILGCSGFICKQKSDGNRVFVLYLSEGVTSRYDNHTIDKKIKQEIENRKKMAIQASKILQFKIVEFLDLPNLRMENLHVLDLVKKITKTIKKIRPSIILTHHPGDLNRDHKVAFESTFAALRPFTFDFKINKFLTYEIPSSTNWSNQSIGPKFEPNFYLNVKKYIDKKKLAFDCYKFEMRKFPHPRSWKLILANHMLRGSEVGLEYAEAYMLIKEIVE